MRNECIGVPPKFPCQHCTVKYRRKEDLLHHMKKKHEGIVVDGSANLSSAAAARTQSFSVTIPTEQTLTSRLQMEVSAQQQHIQHQQQLLLKKDNKMVSEYSISDSSDDLYSYQPKWNYGF